MSQIYYGGNNYNAAQLARLATHGHSEIVETKLIVDIASSKSYQLTLAHKANGMYHLLLGTVDKTKSHVQLQVISTPVLKKARVESTTYEERTTSRAPFNRFNNSNNSGYSNNWTNNQPRGFQRNNYN